MNSDEEKILDKEAAKKHRVSSRWLWALPLIGFCFLLMFLTSAGLLFWQISSRWSGDRHVDSTSAFQEYGEQLTTLSGLAAPATTPVSPSTSLDQDDQSPLSSCQDNRLAERLTATAPLISPISFATRQSDDGWPRDASLQFTTAVTRVQASFSYIGMRDGMVWERVWYYVDQKLLRDSGIWDAGNQGQLTVHVETGEGGFAPGRYRLELYVEGRLLSQGSFLMVSEETPTQRPVQVAYTTWDGRQHDINLLDLASQETEQVLTLGRTPAWSPDATGLIFLGEEGIEAGTAGLWVLNVDQRETYRINELTSFRSLAWSPNRRFLASSVLKEQGPQLVLWNLPQGQAHNGPLGEDPAWSPEGQRLAYRGCSGNDWGIRTMRVISNVFDLDSIQPLTIGDDHQPAWSPDGQRIVFVRREGDNQDIYTVTADGTQLIRLTDHPAIDTTPAWTPDNRLLFRSLRDGQWGIYVMNADGSDQRKLISTGSQPNWQPDRLAVSTDVLMVETPPAAPKPTVHIPSGHGVLVISNRKNNDEMTFTIDNHEHRVSPFQYKTLPLKPGHYTWTASWPGKTSRTGIADIVVGQVAYPIVER